MSSHSSSGEHIIVEQVDRIIKNALHHRASDIHLEPTQEGLRVRFRVDGVLHDYSLVPIHHMMQVLSRIKILAHLNIAERRIPQDGRFIVDHDKNRIDARVSTYPSVFGEKIVIRLLDHHALNYSLDQLGLSSSVRQGIESILNKSQGFFLVTGPTGSGKTTTLYACLAHMDQPGKNIITIEDPVEYHIKGITQGQINPDAGFTFENGMRALLRQDPDIIMIGEIRDRQTAKIAIEASLTGHLVLSTLHTNDAHSAVMRLKDIGIDLFLIATSLSGVLSQRLVRKVCSHCVEEHDVPEILHSLAKLKINLPKKVYKGHGCSACKNTGFHGRVGIFELLIMTDDVRDSLQKQATYDQLYASTMSNGWVCFIQDGLEKADQGLINLHEVLTHA